MLQKKPKYIAIFFLAYSLLMTSLIFFAWSYEGGKSPNSSINEVSSTFSKELNKYETTRIHKEIKSANNWRPSSQFILISLSAASVLDVVIILIWAKQRNKKKSQYRNDRKWTNQNWFWSVVSMGIVQLENGRLVLKWRNLILFLLMMTAVKYWLSKKLGSNDSALFY